MRLSLAAAVLACVGCGSPATNQSQTNVADSVREVGLARETDSAREVGKRFVRENLKSPRSALFAPDDEITVEPRAAGGYRVLGWVDSQNAFGAMPRNHFAAIVKPSGSDWKLLGIWFADVPLQVERLKHIDVDENAPKDSMQKLQEKFQQHRNN
jgi:hypothetical protein